MKARVLPLSNLKCKSTPIKKVEELVRNRNIFTLKNGILSNLNK